MADQGPGLSPEDAGLESDSEQLVGRFAESNSPTPAKAGGSLRGLYSVSLTLVMGTIFVLSWVAQAVAGRVAFNEERFRDLRNQLKVFPPLVGVSPNGQHTCLPRG